MKSSATVGATAASVTMRRGLAVDGEREIGERIGVSQMQVSRLLRRSMRRMLDAVQGRPADNPR